MKNYLLFVLVLVSILFFTNFLSAQKRTYLYTGAEVEFLHNPTPLGNIIADFNNYHNEFNVGTTSNYSMPEYIPGFMIGTKIHSRFSEFGGNVHFMKYLTKARGTDLDGIKYDQTFTLSHSGFCLHYNINWINTNYFRSGPGFGMKLEQFRFKVVDELESSENPAFPVDRALVSGRFYYSISIGGPKFNFDIVAYYHLPFMSLNLTNFNEYLNSGYYVDYSGDEIEYKPTAYGLSVYIGLGSRDNYDF